MKQHYLYFLPNSLAVGEIAMNVTDGKFYTKTSGNVVKEMGGAGAVTLNSVTTGASSSNDITLDGANLIFEVIKQTHLKLHWLLVEHKRYGVFYQINQVF